MPALPRVVLSALLLEDDDLLAAAMANDFARHLGAAERGNTGLHRVSVVAEQNVVELDLAAGIADERRDLVRAAGFDTELLAAGFDDCVGHKRARNCGAI